MLNIVYSTATKMMELMSGYTTGASTTSSSVDGEEEERASSLARPHSAPQEEGLEEQHQVVHQYLDESFPLVSSTTVTQCASIPSMLLIPDDLNLRCGFTLAMFCSIEASNLINKSLLPPIRSILQHCPAAAQHCDPQTGRTALHAAISNRDYLLPELVRLLVTTHPAIVRARDAEGSRALDILAGMALVQEERLKYFSKYNHTVDSTDISGLSKVHDDLEKLWTCARYLVLDPSLYDSDIPALHALLSVGGGGDDAAGDVPMSLLAQAIQHHSLLQTDHAGNLPLHVIADLRRPPNRKADDGRTKNSINNSNNTNDDDDDDAADENSFPLLRRILQEYPAAAHVRNHAGQLPVDLAIASGRRWETGIALLVNACPVAGLDRRFAVRHYPLLLDQLLHQRHCRDAVYAILRSNPKEWIPFLQTMNNPVVE